MNNAFKGSPDKKSKEGENSISPDKKISQSDVTGGNL